MKKNILLIFSLVSVWILPSMTLSFPYCTAPLPATLLTDSVEIKEVPVVEVEEEVGEDEIFKVVEKQPEFPGGMSEMMKYLQKNIKYPAICQKQGIQGRVIVQFVVDTDGSIKDAHVLNPVNPHLDKEALRVVNSMPKWKPGMQKGKNVRVRFTIPVTFKLSTPKSTKGKVLVVKGDNELVEMLVDQMPSFPNGGEAAMRRYISRNMNYPTEAERLRKQGRVEVSFVINADGRLSHFEVSKSDPLFDAEALRLVRRMPRWEPALLNGEPVAVKHSIPITFLLK